MNKNKYLDKLQIKLTVIFTLLVFFISFLLQTTFFSYKYFRGVNNEIKKIENISEILGERKLTFTDINKLIRNEKKIGEIRGQNKNDNDFIEQKGKILNFIILDGENNILLQNIRGNVDIDIDSINEVISSKYSKTRKINNVIINYITLERQIDTYKILLFKELNYDYEDYITDIIKFFIAITIFSLLFFLIGYFFVKRNLKTVRKNIREMDNFIQDAGHELKTPIAVIDSNLQLMKQLGIYKEDIIDENLGEIKRLSNLIDALSELSDVENHKEINICSIKDEIFYILHEYDSMIKEKNINITYKNSQDFGIECNKEYLFIVISNIIKNAIKFSDNNSEIHIKYFNKILEIKDFGCGIDKNNLDKIYDRFYQEKINRNGEGFGIGLSLVAKICHHYNWKIDVKSIQGKGTKFTVNFQ